MGKAARGLSGIGALVGFTKELEVVERPDMVARNAPEARLRVTTLARPWVLLISTRRPAAWLPCFSLR